MPMNRRLLLLTIAWLLTVVGAFKLGLHLGAEVHADLDSSARAALLTRQLTALRGGNQRTVVTMFEFELDGQVVRAMRCATEGCGHLLWPLGNSAQSAVLLKEVAEYRQAHPPLVREGEFGKDVEASTRALHERFGKR